MVVMVVVVVVVMTFSGMYTEVVESLPGPAKRRVDPKGHLALDQPRLMGEEALCNNIVTTPRFLSFPCPYTGDPRPLVLPV